MDRSRKTGVSTGIVGKGGWPCAKGLPRRKERFGETNQADKYQIEVKNRRRQLGETLRSLRSDIRRLVALALPGFDRKARETLACGYFIDALNDPDLALRGGVAPASLEPGGQVYCKADISVGR